MRRKLPPFVECWRDRHGKLRVYFRKARGRRVPLPAVIGSDEFDAGYRAALAGHLAIGREKHVRAAPRTIGALVLSYMRSSAYLSLRETTKVGYAARIETLRAKHGHRTVAGLTRQRIVTGILQPYADRPGAALGLLKLLRILIRHAIDVGWLNHDPSLGIKRPKTQEIRSWTDAEIQRFEQRWAIGTKQRLAFALMLYTGRRRGDVHRMTWADVSDGSIRVVQQKTGRKLTIPLHRNLLEVLAVAERHHVTIINTQRGMPFTVDGFGQWFRDAITAAGPAHEIMAVLGHKTLTEAERYTREADQTLLATAALAKLEGRSANTDAQTVSDGLGKASKTEEKSR